MAQSYRSVDFDFGDDPWVLSLDANGRLLFLTLFICRESHVSGVYKISTPILAFRTALQPAVIVTLLTKFQQDGKVVLEGNPDSGAWVFVRAMQRYQIKGQLSATWAKELTRHVMTAPKALQEAYLTAYGAVIEDALTNHAPPIIRTPKDTEANTDTQAHTNRPIAGPPIDESKGSDTLSVEYATAAKAYEREIGMLTATVAECLKEAVKDYPADWIPEAIAKAAQANVRKWTYVEGVLKRWKVEGKGDRGNGRDNTRARRSGLSSRAPVADGHYDSSGVWKAG